MTDLSHTTTILHDCLLLLNPSGIYLLGFSLGYLHQFSPGWRKLDIESFFFKHQESQLVEQHPCLL